MVIVYAAINEQFYASLKEHTFKHIVCVWRIMLAIQRNDDDQNVNSCTR